MKKTKKIILFSCLALIVVLLSTLYMPFTRKSTKVNDQFEYVLRDGVKNPNAKLVDIAMLGAHDAFSSDIKISSKPNVNEGGVANNKVINTLAKGLVVRMSKAQIATPKEMLYAGVRYFDVRITKIGDTYYTCHGYLSNKLEEYVKPIVDFLKEHPSEFIIFDILYFYTEDAINYEIDEEEFQKLFDYLSNLGLMDYVISGKDIDELTYSDLTHSQTKAGVVMLAKTTDFDNIYFRDKDASYKRNYYYTIRSLWHENNSTKQMLEKIDEENNYIKENEYLKEYLRVNQAQKTGFITNASLIRSLFNWSLINYANNFNKILVSDEARFSDWLTTMPIFMVDYATSNKGNFNKLANEYIMKHNQTL